MINLTQSGLFLGYLIGSYVLGTLGDLFGRRKVIIGYFIGLALTNTVVALSPNFYIFAIGRFLVGFLVPGGITIYIIFYEMTGPFHRSLLASLSGATFGLAFGPLALSAYLFHNWKLLAGFAAILNLLMLLFYRSIIIIIYYYQ